jgi:hypothetical protein
VCSTVGTIVIGSAAGSLHAVGFEQPSPDLSKLVAAWDEWERGEQTPGKVLANLKTAGFAVVLRSLVDSGWTPSE